MMHCKTQSQTNFRVGCSISGQKRMVDGMELNSSEFFMNEQRRAKKLSYSMSRNNLMGRAVRPMSSSYIQAQKGKITNNVLKLNIDHKGYAKAEKDRKIKANTEKMDHSIFTKIKTAKTDTLDKKIGEPLKKHSTIGVIGSRAMFTEHTFTKAIPRVIIREPPPSENFYVGESVKKSILSTGKKPVSRLTMYDLLPKVEENFTDEQIKEQVAYDSKEGYNYARYLAMVKESIELLKDFEKEKSYMYIHKLRHKQLEYDVPMIRYEEVLKLLSEIDKDKQYVGKDNPELREVFFKANDLGMPPPIDQTDLRKRLLDLEIPIQEKKRQEEYLISTELSKDKLCGEGESKVLWKKAVHKEYTNAWHNAVLAAHYIKQQKYTTDGRFDKFIDKVKPLVEKTAPVDIEDFSSEKMNLLIGDKQMRTQIKNLIVKLINEENYPPRKFVNDIKRCYIGKKDQPFGETHKEPQFTKEIFDLNPSIYERLEKYHYKGNRKWEFEDELERAKWGWGNANSQNLSLEEQIFNYAREFKQNAQWSENLLATVKLDLIPDLDYKMGEYDKEVVQWNKKRFDYELQFREYVKLKREGKL